jgi:hypothetical protein
MRASGRVSIVGLAAAACLAVAAPAAQAWVKVATAAGDPQTTWIVTPHSITIRSTNPVLLRFVRNSDVLLCQHPPTPVFWGPTASSITLHTKAAIPRDLSDCEALEVGRVPGFLTALAFSRVGFTSASRRQLASTPPPGQLLARSNAPDTGSLCRSWSRCGA